MATRKHKVIPELKQSEIDRLWAGVDKDGPIQSHVPHLGQCWVWTKHTYGRGYGRIQIRRTGIAAHRLSWFIHNGEIPSGQLVLHRCDNPLCVRPEHLFIGTNMDNTRDSIEKGRFRTTGASGLRNARYTKPERTARGDRSGAAKLTSEDVLEIRKMLTNRKRGVIASLARKYNVNVSTIWDIEWRVTWSHL